MKDKLDCRYIKRHLNFQNKHRDIIIFDEITSTNEVLRRELENGKHLNSVFVAKTQTAGRGRLGRSFFSTEETGLYFSLSVTSKDFRLQDMTVLTTIAAVAMCEAISSVIKVRPEIKWVNDIYVGGKKVCGILCQSAKVNSAVVGVGVNIYPPTGGFPNDINDIAGSLLISEKKDIKNKILADFINRFFKYCRKKNKMCYINRYKKYSFIVGKDIAVIKGENKRNAYVLGINDDCMLLVRYENGEEEILSSGEISIKVKQIIKENE